MKNITIVVLITFLPFNTMAQYNDTLHYHVKLLANGTLNKTDAGNSYLFNNTLKFGVKKSSMALNFNAGWLFGENQNSLTNNDLISTLDFNIDASLPHLYYWGLANYTSSYSLKINNQYQAGAGLAYNVYDRHDVKINLSNGLIYEESDLQINDTTRRIYNTIRNSLRLTFRFKIKKIITINSVTFLQPSLDHKNDFILKSENTLAIKLYKWLSVNAALNYNKISTTNKENFTLTYGLSFERFF